MQEQTKSKLDSTNSFTLREAATACGVSIDTIKRRHSDGRFPNAAQQKGRTGKEWRIPSADLAKVADEESWTLQLAPVELEHGQANVEALMAEFVATAKAQADAEAQLEQSKSREKEADAKLRQVTSDLENERQALNEVTQQLTESTKEVAVAEARIEELRKRVDQAAQERDSLGQSMRELEKSSAESLSVVSRDLDNVRSSLEIAENETRTAVGERDELAAKAQKLEDSLSWWARRKYRGRNVDG